MSAEMYYFSSEGMYEIGEMRENYDTLLIYDMSNWAWGQQNICFCYLSTYGINRGIVYLHNCDLQSNYGGRNDEKSLNGVPSIVKTKTI